MGPSVLIVDDHAAFRGHARRLLESAGYVVVGEAPDGASAIVAARRLRPDVVLLDVQLPDVDGFEVADILARDASDSAVVLVSVRDAAEYGSRIERCSARGFIAKVRLSGASLAKLLAS